MTIQKILGEKGPQKGLCTGGACPAAISADDGNVYVQGYIPSKEAADTLTMPDGEAVVCMPLETAKKIAAQVVNL